MAESSNGGWSERVVARLCCFYFLLRSASFCGVSIVNSSSRRRSGESLCLKLLFRHRSLLMFHKGDSCPFLSNYGIVRKGSIRSRSNVLLPSYAQSHASRNVFVSLVEVTLELIWTVSV